MPLRTVLLIIYPSLVFTVLTEGAKTGAVGIGGFFFFKSVFKIFLLCGEWYLEQDV